MSSFNNLLGRLSFITEAKGVKSGRSLKKDLPSYLRDPYNTVYAAAQEKGTTAPREARVYIVDIIASLISNKLGRELSTNEFEKGLKKLYNVSSGDMFLKYLETNKPENTEETYSQLLSGLSISDVEQAESKQKISREEKLQQQISLRPASKDYESKAASRELKKREQEVAREKKKEIKKLEKAAQKSGNEDLADTFNVIDDIVTKTAQQIGVDVETQVDPETMGYARFAKGVQQSKDVGLDEDTLDISLTGRLASAENIDKIIKAFSRVKGVTAGKMAGKPGVTVDLPVGMIKSADDANTQVERLFGNLFPGEDIENIDVQFYTDSEDEEGDGDVEAEYYPGVTDEDKEEASMPWPEDEEEGYRVIGVTTSGEKFKSGILPNKKAADDKHWKMTQATDKRGKKIYKSIEVVKEAVMDNEDSMMLGESYTSNYMSEEFKKRKTTRVISESISFKEKYKPKTSYQLDELRRYGL